MKQNTTDRFLIGSWVSFYSLADKVLLKCVQGKLHKKKASSRREPSFLQS